jgi:hypothetical protein
VLDVTRVTVLGESRKRVTTRDRRGVVTERCEVRWPALLRSGSASTARLTPTSSSADSGLYSGLPRLALVDHNNPPTRVDIDLQP